MAEISDSPEDRAPGGAATAEPAGVAAFEHLTGPSRGTVTWMSGEDLDVTLLPNCLIRLSPARAGAPHEGMVARLHRSGESYEIEAMGGDTIWVNGIAVDDRKLVDGDTVEFCESGPISRFNLYSGTRRIRTTASDIFGDAVAYLRASRRPVVRRVCRAAAQVTRRLARETTVLYRVMVVLSLVVLGVLAYQQLRLNSMFEERIAGGSERLDSFAAALSRARDEALAPGDLAGLREELGQKLTTASERLAALERRSKASARVVAQSSSAVIFLQGAYGFRESATGRMLRHVVGEDGQPVISSRGQPTLSLDGDGPVAERQFSGTAFAVGDKGRQLLVTNRHVAIPWETDATYEAFAAQGLEPVMTKFIAYRPGHPRAVPAELVIASEDVDLAVLAGESDQEAFVGLSIETTPPAQGEEVIVMGYPTGLRSMLAQAGDAFVRQLQEIGETDFWSVASRLAESGHIAPLASRGIVGQVSEAALVYDAETTLGGSGGPVLNVDGAVVAVNTAILPEFGGSNIGIPGTKVAALLAAAQTQ